MPSDAKNMADLKNNLKKPLIFPKKCGIIYLAKNVERPEMIPVFRFERNGCMKLKKFGSTEQKVYDLAAPIITGMGLLVWDVRYEKEGAGWYLRIFIDSETDAVSISDCERVTAPISDMLDREDPIPQSYTLEISSAGLEADLIRESQVDACIGCEVQVKGFRAFADGSGERIGVLKDWDKDGILLAAPEGEEKLDFAALAYVKLYFDFNA